jgi:two-component system, chemotaxis family, chemotaxis protein CheV
MTMKSSLSILLESDTNELEALEFCVDDGATPGYFGVNVAKVMEIIRMQDLSCTVLSSKTIAGTISLRGKVITVLDLAKVLGRTPDKPPERIIILEFNGITVGVMVNTASRIHRLSWSQIETPPPVVADLYVIALVKMDNRIILLLDFERILAEFSGTTAMTPMPFDPLPLSLVEGRKILLVDDSSFIRNSISALLRNAGFRVEEAHNGEDAWNLLREKLDRGGFDIDIIITDVEMPRMDGLHLTSLIKKETRLNGVPVFIFSSLASEANNRKWKHIGADGIITKPDLPHLVQILSSALAALPDYHPAKG